MSSLATLCTVANVQAALPVNGTILGVDLLPSTVTANVANSTSTYCNVTVSYTHTGAGDNVVLWYTLPSPDAFQNRFYILGGFGYQISSGSPTGGLEYGAVSGATDVGYSGYTNNLDAVVLNGNGSLNWQNLHMFSYQAWGETAQVGKELTKAFYSVEDKVYTYFEGCSDGGRQAMSQAQRYGDVYDGIVSGCPAFHYAQQQVNHVTSVVAQKLMGYIAPPCEMSEIVSQVIAACDPLDGRTDGVVSRTDLCRMNFNLSSLVGVPYYCEAQTATSQGFGFSGSSKRGFSKRGFSKRGFSKRQAGAGTSSYVPEQNGTISVEAVALANALYDGLLNSKGEQVMYGWQHASEFSDAAPTWSNDTESWTLAAPDIGGAFVTKFVQMVDMDNLESLDGIDYDTLYDWMFTGYTRFYDTLQTGYADLSTLQANGGKLLHYHGESDNSVPPPSSVRYHEAVRTTMYPDSTPDNATELSDFYQFYLVPGAAHCGTNKLQPGPYPADNMATIIAWVEQGVKPTRLNATVTTGDHAGEVQQLCQWPLRPTWASNSSTTFDCAYDEASFQSWQWDLNAWKIPVY